MSAARIIDGKAIAEQLRGKVAAGAAALERRGVKVGLAVVLVGEDPASAVYVKNKGIAARVAGFHSEEHRLPASTPEGEVLALVARLNADDRIDGILVQMPLPPHIDAQRVISAIDPAKDVDGLTATSAGRLALGERGLVPCTPQGCIILAKRERQDLTGLRAVVVGRSILVGKPLALLLLSENATVTIAHSRTRHLKEECQRADVLCAAVGRPEMIRGDFVKPGAIVIDVGINRVERDGKTKLVGDVAFEEAASRAAAITPVPGGVGPMTIACLLANAARAAARRRGLADPL
jgi:methylenetetrahydrofolate dehydrogenase (NADP+)/methenyltetrahydrofolate cyclohydrolase